MKLKSAALGIPEPPFFYYKKSQPEHNSDWLYINWG